MDVLSAELFYTYGKVQILQGLSYETYFTCQRYYKNFFSLFDYMTRCSCFLKNETSWRYEHLWEAYAQANCYVFLKLLRSSRVIDGVTRDKSQMARKPRKKTASYNREIDVFRILFRVLALISSNQFFCKQIAIARSLNANWIIFAEILVRISLAKPCADWSLARLSAFVTQNKRLFWLWPL